MSFARGNEYWAFARSVRSQRRYIHAKEAGAFLDAVVESAQRRTEVLPSGTLLWRAQRGGSKTSVEIYPGADDFVEEDCPFGKDRMKPVGGRAREGRVNPKGIPYLYLATHRDTALAEVRPWKGGVVSVGQFRVVGDVRLVNTTIDSKFVMFVRKDAAPQQREEAVWGSIDSAFAAPTSLSDDGSEYVPTQVLGEALRDSGYDGIGYRSSYGPGHNVVLFDVDLAEQVNALLVRVKDISFVFDLREEHSYTVRDNKPVE
jgi:hypothetical protein